MTIVMGLQGKDHVVMAADRLGHTLDGSGMYGFGSGKLHIISAGSREWVVGVAGSLDALTVVKAVSREALEGECAVNELETYADKLGEVCRHRGFEDDMWFLVAGIDKAGPFIYQISFLEQERDRGEGRKWIGPLSVGQTMGYCAIGAAAHGALYFASEHHKPEMSESQRLLLAHFCLTEACKHDMRVGGPVDMAVVGNGPARFIAESDAPVIVARSKFIATRIGELLLAPYGETDLITK
jgi:20S proteasome alpha/beta subunit